MKSKQQWDKFNVATTEDALLDAHWEFANLIEELKKEEEADAV